MPFGDMVQISLTEGGETITVTEPAGVTVGDLRDKFSISTAFAATLNGSMAENTTPIYAPTTGGPAVVVFSPKTYDKA